MLDQVIYQQPHNYDKYFFQRKVSELKRRLTLRLGYHQEHEIIYAINNLPPQRIYSNNLIELQEEVEKRFRHWSQDTPQPQQVSTPDGLAMKIGGSSRLSDYSHIGRNQPLPSMPTPMSNNSAFQNPYNQQMNQSQIFQPNLAGQMALEKSNRDVRLAKRGHDIIQGSPFNALMKQHIVPAFDKSPNITSRNQEFSQQNLFQGKRQSVEMPTGNSLLSPHPPIDQIQSPQQQVQTPFDAYEAYVGDQTPPSLSQPGSHFHDKNKSVSITPNVGQWQEFYRLRDHDQMMKQEEIKKDRRNAEMDLVQEN